MLHGPFHSQGSCEVFLMIITQVRAKREDATSLLVIREKSSAKTSKFAFVIARAGFIVTLLSP